MVQPIEVSGSVIAGIDVSGSLPTHSMGVAEAGTVYPSSDGSRLLTHVSGFDAYFIQSTENTGEPWKVGRVFKQDRRYFAEDINRGGVGGILKQKLAGTKNVISNFLDIYLGCMSVAGGPVAWSITGMQLVVAGGKIKQNYDLYVEALEAFADNETRSLIPTFHEHIFVELYLGRIESYLTGKKKEMAVEGIVKNKAVAEIVGVFIGKIGEDAMTRTLKGIGKMIREVLLKVIDHKISGKPLSEDQISGLAEYHVTKLYFEMSQIPLRMDRAKAIVREAANNAAAVRPRLLKIAKAVDALAG